MTNMPSQCSFLLDIDPNARGLIFDLDGTLINTMDLHYNAWKEVGEKFGFEYPEELFYRLAGTPTRKIVPILNETFGLSLDVEKTTAEKENAFLRHIDEIHIIEPVAAIARKYHGILPMAVGTGNTRKLTEMLLEVSGLKKYFAVVITADDVVHHKPHPETFLLCAQKMNVSPQLCQVFEDGDAGLEAARSGGMIATDVRPFVFNGAAQN